MNDNPDLEEDVKRILKHAQINTEIQWLDDNIGNQLIVNSLNSYIATTTLLPPAPPIPTDFLVGNLITPGLHTYLKGILGNRKRGHITLFFINFDGGSISSDGDFNQLGGYSGGVGSDIVIYKLNSNDNVTLSHEILHSLGVPHTFDKTDNNSSYTFRSFSTENIMDYQDPSPDPTTLPIQDEVLSARHSTFHWQWLIARKNIGKK